MRLSMGIWGLQMFDTGKTRADLDGLQAAIEKQKDIDAKQDIVVERIAGAVNNILKFIEAKNTLTPGQQAFVNNFCDAYDNWIESKES